MAEPNDVSRVKIAQEQNAGSLFARPNVIGTATGYRQSEGEYTEDVCVQVFVSRKYPRSHLPSWAVVPWEVPGPDGEGVPTDVIDAGYFQPIQDTTRYRPVVGGCSIGNLTGTNAGTLGGWACDETDDSTVFLTNNHVVTASTNRTAIPATSGIVQPGQLDGGSAPADQIGQTKRIVPIPTNPSQGAAPTTAVDAAIGTITAGRDHDVLNIGPAIYEIATPTLGMNVQKRGRTTQLTTNGRIVSVNASWTLNYGRQFNPAFAQIGIGNSVFNIASTDGNRFGDRGDSGSLIFAQNTDTLEGTRPVLGLLFAGGSTGPGAEFGTLIGACNINSVFNRLNLTTICDCAVRAILEAIFEGTEHRETTGLSKTGLRRKERQLRGVRERIVDEAPLGEAAVKLVTKKTPAISEVLVKDDKAFGLAVRAFGSLRQTRTALDLLQTELDEETVEDLSALAQRIAEINPDLEEPARLLESAVSEAEGSSLADLIGSKGPEQRGYGKNQ